MIEPILKTAPGLHPGQPNCSRIGKLSREAVKLFVHQQVLDQILDYSEQNLQQEIGGFLIGNLFEEKGWDGELRYVEIQDFLPAATGVSHAASLKFNHRTWSHANREVQARFPGQRIVGWHHTHPDLGVFLSAYDRFIHQNFFDQDWQIAMVVDPCQQEFAFYQWQRDELTDCGFIFVPDSPNLN